jgi:hypothetical protein
MNSLLKTTFRAPSCTPAGDGPLERGPLRSAALRVGTRAARNERERIHFPSDAYS